MSIGWDIYVGVTSSSPHVFVSGEQDDVHNGIRGSTYGLRLKRSCLRQNLETPSTGKKRQLGSLWNFVDLPDQRYCRLRVFLVR